MASVDYISDSILSRVILPLVADKTPYIEVWKRKLPILAVCSRWRKLAIQFVYNQVFFIDYDVFCSTGGRLDLLTRDQASIADDKKQDKQLVTNVDLLALNNCWYLAEYMFISTNEFGMQRIFFDKLLDIFKQYSGEWIGIKNIFPNSVHIPSLRTYNNHPRHLQEYNLMPIVNYMKNNFTLVRFVEHSYSSDILGDLSNKMIRSYADKLSVIRGEMSSVTHLKYLPQHLTHLDLSFGYIREVLVLPIIVTDSLKELTFRSLPPDFDWKCFENSSEPLNNNVCFKNLEYFYVHYDSGSYYKRENKTELSELVDRFKFKMIFPKLIELLIHNCIRNNSLLHADFPSKLNKIWFKGTVASMTLCRQIKIKSKLAMIQFASCSVNSHRDSIAVHTTARDYNKADKIYIMLKDVVFNLLLFSLTLKSLIEIMKINYSISIDELESILMDTHNLKILILHRSATNYLLRTIHQTEYSKQQSTNRYTLFANIQHISLSYSINADSYTRFALTRYFLVSCPDLGYIPAKIDIKQDVERFIDRSSDRLGYLRKDVVEYF